MDLGYPLDCLEVKWRTYLRGRGHYIYKAAVGPQLLRSRNATKSRYRWLLLVGKRAICRLSKSEQAYIRQQLRQAKTRIEATYLVVGFIQEPKRIVVLPAKAALKAQCVRSDKGGIDWYD